MVKDISPFVLGLLIVFGLSAALLGTVVVATYI